MNFTIFFAEEAKIDLISNLMYSLLSLQLAVLSTPDLDKWLNQIMNDSLRVQSRITLCGSFLKDLLATSFHEFSYDRHVIMLRGHFGALPVQRVNESVLLADCLDDINNFIHHLTIQQSKHFNPKTDHYLNEAVFYRNNFLGPMFDPALSVNDRLHRITTAFHIMAYPKSSLNDIMLRAGIGDLTTLTILNTDTDTDNIDTQFKMNEFTCGISNLIEGHSTLSKLYPFPTAK